MSRFSKFFGSAIGGIVIKFVIALVKNKYPNLPIDEATATIIGAAAGTYIAPANSGKLG